MKRIRPFVRDDIQQVAELHHQIFGAGGIAGQRSFSPKLSQVYADYFEEIFFRNPWYDEALSSLVYQEPTGRITGFLGVMPRRMTINGELIKVAVSSQFIVAPDKRSTGVMLLKTFFAGPQSLSLTDEANMVSRRLWEKLGGAVAMPYSIHWTRLLRPSRFAVSLFNSFLWERRPWPYLASMLKPVCNLADNIIGRQLPKYFHQTTPRITAEELKTETLLAHLSEFADAGSLRPQYDDRSLKWLIETVARKERYGALRMMALHNAEREKIGWYIYHLRPGGESVVLQLVARNNSMSDVLDHLFYDAWRHDSAAVSGRLDPRFPREVSDKYCLFKIGRPWALIHSRDPELLKTFHDGAATFSKLEGEWCIRFV